MVGDGRPPLIPNSIPRLVGVELRDHIPVPNQSGARYGLTPDLRRWVVKHKLPSEGLLAEALGWLLSETLGVPVAAAGIFMLDGAPGWASGWVEPATHWSGARLESLENPEGLGAILALDAIIGNPDRHAANLLLQTVEPDLKHRVISIDLGNAWIGDPARFAARDLETHDPELFAPPADIPLALVRPGALLAVALAEGVSLAALTDYVREACDIAGSSDYALLTQALHRRLKAARELVENYLAKLEALQS
jgi:hypothetical protein